MPYLLLIAEPKGQRLERTPEQGREAYASMQRFADDLQSRGVFLGCNSLQSDDKAVRVQVRDGKSRTLDGPFSESKEMIGGYFLIDCATSAEAVAIAEECPAAAWASVDVRPIGPCWE